MKRLKIGVFFFFGMVMAGSLFSPETGQADDAPVSAEETQSAAPKSELDNLKAEWEAVREQQIQMIREKEEQLEKLKEEIFAKMKAQESPAVPAAAPVAPNPILPVAEINEPVLNNPAEFEKQKAALQAERKKFFTEMNRQKESLLKLQAALDEKAKQLEAERQKFESEKKAVAS